MILADLFRDYSRGGGRARPFVTKLRLRPIRSEPRGQVSTNGTSPAFAINGIAIRIGDLAGSGVISKQPVSRGDVQTLRSKFVAQAGLARGVS